MWYFSGLWMASTATYIPHQALTSGASTPSRGRRPAHGAPRSIGQAIAHQATARQPRTGSCEQLCRVPRLWQGLFTFSTGGQFSSQCIRHINDTINITCEVDASGKEQRSDNSMTRPHLLPHARHAIETSSNAKAHRWSRTLYNVFTGENSTYVTSYQCNEDSAPERNCCHLHGMQEAGNVTGHDALL
ncbi:hypothetical protein HYPSUDRAFT_352453 [Hypholoma sublateritium FD-334 SS-4]|uniref:Uncharacterized protein n=1 Tax=Hypholoma sublateritium (strain FD-334 SS-4) TaxID=945553 RepID=A0A0D2Q3G6_HYPSF|nr:hypothetical protein HYPSUDRAFT_352453 [Hypholoma sublateritium FD-334 SS-4]